MAKAEPLSNRAINRAGDFLRELKAGKQGVELSKLVEAHRVVYAFRSQWSRAPHPLTKVGMGLRSMATTATGGSAQVSQRLKRAERIIDKLERFPHMNLAQMQDIGGCRVVVPTLSELQALRGRIRQEWAKSIDDEDDYIARPRKSGYRAAHIVVKRDEHLVEIQLRTRRQHRWAASVEYVEQRGSGWLRDSAAGHALTDAFRDLGLVFALRDQGEPAPPELLERLKHWLSALDEG